MLIAKYPAVYQHKPRLSARTDHLTPESATVQDILPFLQYFDAVGWVF